MLFKDCKTIEDAKKIYRAELMRVHPDHGGSNDETVKVINEFNDFLNDFMAGRINDFKVKMEQDGKKWNKDGLNSFVFAEILKKIIHLDITIEIIGFWVYCFNSYEVREYLQKTGFWFSKKHKAWIFSGSKKAPIRSKNTTQDNRNNWGSIPVKNQGEDETRKIA